MESNPEKSLTSESPAKKRKYNNIGGGHKPYWVLGGSSMKQVKFI